MSDFSSPSPAVSVDSNKEVVKRYYNYTRIFYRLFWHGDTDSLHYGFYDETVKNHREALLKTIEVTAQSANVSSGDEVVDLGCGVGGTAFWITKNIGAHATGITISEAQYKKAKRLRAKYGLEANTEFVLGDFFHTPFFGDNFDVIVSIEASCYGQYAIDALAREMYRILKPGGRIAIMDGYLGTKELTSVEQKQVRDFEVGLALQKMITPDAFMSALKKVGFLDVSFSEYTENVLPTAKYMAALTSRWHALTKLLTRLKIVPSLVLKNNIAGQVQYELTKNRALVYGCITAKK